MSRVPRANSDATYTLNFRASPGQLLGKSMVSLWSVFPVSRVSVIENVSMQFEVIDLFDNVQ